MQLSQIMVLACSTLALAKPYQHRSYKSGCASASTGAASGSAASNLSSAALPYPIKPTATAAFSSAGGASIGTLSPSGGYATASSASVPVASVASFSPAQLPAKSSPTLAAAPVASSTAAAAPVSGGTTYTATFTEYGAGDTFGSGNCNTATAACGWYSNPGYNAAASQNIFGVGPGAGAGPACGLCFQLTALTNPYANNAPLSGTQTIVIKVNNLCPADGNALCSQSNLTSKNSLGGEVNFDLCKDDGAAAALFGSSGVGAALGTAVQVSCDSWPGSGNLTS